MNNDVKYKVIELVKSLPVCNINTAQTQYTIRCPYCGDSRNINHGHFSIHIDVNTDTPMLFRCFKCDKSGIINISILEDIGLNVGIDLNDSLRVFNKKIIKRNKLIDNSVENYIVPLYKSSLLNDKKKDYLNNRLGTNYSYEELQELKVILDLFEFIKLNEIKYIPNVSFKYLDLLNENYIGFLSTNNNCITFRCIHSNVKLMRYSKVILNPSNINGNTFYNIPNKLDLLYTDSINIHITEGIFDILSVYSNVNDNNKERNYYFASCGFGYNTILRYLIYNGINTGLTIHIYSDNDKSDYNHKKYLFNNNYLSEWFERIIIHRNTFGKEKDYGVPKDRIIDSQFILK